MEAARGGDLKVAKASRIRPAAGCDLHRCQHHSHADQASGRLHSAQTVKLGSRSCRFAAAEAGLAPRDLNL
jgi:hypothetical protein